ncbi:MalY/PatB family protein [Flexibacterium corallicola]|uniref:MalY/PatB family protein n=1 Tax=Flexibacterium corallicola TaxID=3037259 RepID=UPI00286F7D3D|nr:MalY/PatB family protein [Pseudovibrio sp. M1P-2-3]
MSIDFDKVIDRRNSNSLKWDEMEPRFGISKEDGIPMWVADMDFRPPQAVNDMLFKQADHGINGYFGNNKDFQDSIISWLKRRHNYTIDREWISSVPGVVAAYSLAIQAFSEEGDGVLVFSPVYHAFARAIKANGRKLIESELILENGRYSMDIDGLDELVDEKTKILLLCSPHNPGGTVWTQEELKEISEYCCKRGILIISDEVHHDLVFEGHKHFVTAGISEEIADNTITLAAVSKTFNLAGFATAYSIISNGKLRDRFNKHLHACSVDPNRLGMLATVAAYNHGEQWLDELLQYLSRNQETFINGIETAIPGVNVMRLESTYLSWVDCTEASIPISQISKKIEREAKICINHGKAFGKGGENFLRFNLACPHSVVEKAVDRLSTVFASA